MTGDTLSVDGPSDLSEGDQIVVEFTPTSADMGDSTVLETTVAESDPDGMLEGYTFGEVYLNEYHSEDDTLPRRRLKCTAGDWNLEYRQTTRNGARWTRMNRISDCEIRMR